MRLMRLMGLVRGGGGGGAPAPAVFTAVAKVTKIDDVNVAANTWLGKTKTWRTMSDSLKRIVVITGAVGNLGTATTTAFQNAGDLTVLVDRSTDRLRAAYPTLVGSTDHLLAGGVDVTDEAAVRRLVDQVLTRYNRIDVLVNTVGTWRGGKPVHEDGLENWDLLFRTNLWSALHCCRAVVPSMLRQGRGSIINIASRSALAGEAGVGAYSASKSAVLRLTESLSAELKAYNINVNCVMPGTIDTPQNRQAMPDADVTTWVEPAAIADVIVFLASLAARAIHGAAIPVYGKG